MPMCKKTKGHHNKRVGFLLQAKEKVLLLPSYYNDEIIINIKTHFHTKEKLLELFCIKNDSVKYFAKYCNFYTAEQIKFPYAV